MLKTNNSQEIWKPVPNYETEYMVSNFGNVKSLARITKMKDGRRNYTVTEKLLKISGKGTYFTVKLSKNGIAKTINIHYIVWACFGDQKSEKGLDVDHKDNNQKNNHIDNLRLVTHRYNISRGMIIKKKYGSTTGVNFDKARNNWRVDITINGKKKFLGSFKTEEDARLSLPKEKEVQNATA